MLEKSRSDVSEVCPECDVETVNNDAWPEP